VGGVSADAVGDDTESGIAGGKLRHVEMVACLIICFATAGGALELVMIGSVVGVAGIVGRFWVGTATAGEHPESVVGDGDGIVVSVPDCFGATGD
jgi:hypothetical protein